MAVIGFGGPEEQGERLIPPVSKFQSFLSNYIGQVEKSPTGIAAETASIALEKALDKSEILPQEELNRLNERIPGLKIPQGTRTDTARALTRNQMQKNLNSSIVNDPQNNGKLAWSGAILGGTQRFVLDPTVITSALLAGGAGAAIARGSSLVASHLVPESVALGRFFPTIAQRLTLGGIEGGVFGFADGLTSSAIEGERRKVEEGEGFTTREVVRNAIDESIITSVGGIFLHAAAKSIFKGFKLLKGDFNKNPVLEEELANRAQEEEKKSQQERLESVRENLIKGAEENVVRGKESLNKAFENTDKAITQFQIARPDNVKINEIAENVRTIQKENIPLNEKAHALFLIKKELSDLSVQNNNILAEEKLIDVVLGEKFAEKFPRAAEVTKVKVGPLFDIEKELNNYTQSLADSTKAEGVNSLTQILSDFRMVTPNDFSNMQKTAIAQMQEGRSVNVEPYLNEVVGQNGRNLIERLDEAGFNKGQVLHAVLDSLDNIKNKEGEIKETLKNAKKLLKETKDKGERALIKGTIGGREALLTGTVQQRAVHELLATAITDGFKKNTGEEITSFLKNQTSRDADFEGGYQKLVEDLNNDTIESVLARVEEKPAPFTPEAAEDIEKINVRKELARPMIEDAFKCLTGE